MIFDIIRIFILVMSSHMLFPINGVADAAHYNLKFKIADNLVGETTSKILNTVLCFIDTVDIGGFSAQLINPEGTTRINFENDDISITLKKEGKIYNVKIEGDTDKELPDGITHVVQLVKESGELSWADPKISIPLINLYKISLFKSIKNINCKFLVKGFATVHFEFEKGGEHKITSKLLNNDEVFKVKITSLPNNIPHRLISKSDASRIESLLKAATSGVPPKDAPKVYIKHQDQKFNVFLAPKMISPGVFAGGFEVMASNGVQTVKITVI